MYEIPTDEQQYDDVTYKPNSDKLDYFEQECYLDPFFELTVSEAT